MVNETHATGHNEDEVVERPFVNALDYLLKVLRVSDESFAEIDMKSRHRDDLSRLYPKRAKRKARRNTKSRADYGLGGRDWFSAVYNIVEAYAEVLRVNPSESSQNILNNIIFLDEQDSLYSFTEEDLSKVKEYRSFIYEQINETWYSDYIKVLQENPVSPVSASDYQHDLAFIRSIPSRPEAIWSQWRGIITDPTISTLEKLKETLGEEEYKKVLHKHRRQRVLYKISDLDAQHSKLSYVHWLIVNASIVLASTQSISYPAGDDYDDWSVKLLKFAEGIYIAGFSGTTKLSPEDEKVRDEAIKNLPKYLEDLWD